MRDNDLEDFGSAPEREATPDFTVTLTPDDDVDLGRGRLAWLAACEAAPCPPLWARLARTALSEGWSDDEGLYWGLVLAAVALAGVAGAPAGERTTIAPDGDDVATYETCAGTTITWSAPFGEAPSIVITGRSPLSVVRRAIAGVKVLGAGTGTWIPADLVEAAAADAAAIAANKARASLLQEVITAGADCYQW